MKISRSSWHYKMLDRMDLMNERSVETTCRYISGAFLGVIAMSVFFAMAIGLPFFMLHLWGRAMLTIEKLALENYFQTYAIMSFLTVVAAIASISSAMMIAKILGAKGPSFNGMHRVPAGFVCKGRIDYVD